MREFFVSISQHRPDGYTTSWISASRKFSLPEMKAKLQNIAIDVGTGRFPLEKATVSMQCGYTIFENNPEGFVYSDEVFIEFIVPKTDVSIMLSYLQNKWRGKWHSEQCEWGDLFAYERADLKKR